MPEIVGTKLNYRLRGIDYRIELAEHEIAATAMAVTLRRRSPFGIAVSPRGVSFFSGEGSSPRFTLGTTPYETIDVDVMSWPDNPRAIRRFVARAVDANAEVAVTIHDLPPNADVEWKVDGESAFVKSDALGEVTGQLHLHPEKPQFIEIQPRNLPGPLRKG